MDQALKKLDPTQKQRVALPQEPNQFKKAPLKSTPKEITSPAAMLTEADKLRPKVGPQPSRFISAKIKKEIWLRDKGKCQYEHALSRRKCGSTYRLEYDHKTPFARGGLTNHASGRNMSKLWSVGCYKHGNNGVLLELSY